MLHRFVFSNTIAQIPIALEHVGAGLATTVSGWGRVSSGGASPARLRFVNKFTISNEDCRSRLTTAQANRIHDSTICTFIATGQGTCFGDSGSGLVVDGQVVGVVSWGVPCAIGRPDMYGRVDVAAGWIIDTIGEIED